MMRFFWFDWDDPKGSIFRGAVLFIIEVVLVSAYWMVGWVVDLSYILPSGLLGIVAFGYLAIFLGLLFLALGVAAWLSRLLRHPRR
jgi:hypothetical protein